MTSSSSSRQQPLINICGYKVCLHAHRRILSRSIRESEIIYTLNSPNSIAFNSHHRRTIIYNNETQLSIIIDNETSIIVTVTETDRRRSRMSISIRKQITKLYGTTRVYYPPSLLLVGV
jgi:hypothetical protein